MNRFLNMLLPIGVLCILGTGALAAFWFVMVVAASFGFQWPFHFFQHMGLPALSIAIPVIGMLIFIPFARRMVVEADRALQKDKIGESKDLRGGERKSGGKFHLRPA
jgi:hypothetical protein